ncbi:MAG: M1 family aminopeptidase [Desulfobacterales bacterium]
MDCCKQNARPPAILLAGLFLLIAFPVEALDVHHNLRITLHPADNRLEGVDTITIGPAAPDEVVLYLTEKATGLNLLVDGRPAPFSFENGRLRLEPGSVKTSDPLYIRLAYTAVFNDPVPVMPANTDNPGYGVSGTISPQGTLLLYGAGWYPHVDAERVTFGLNVEAPAGVVAVTAGRSLGHRTDGDRTISTWVIDHPVRGLSLSAARYEVREETFGRVTAATYFLPQSDDLSRPYLAATGRYLRLYESLFGPYPFDKFAVVENFFPTGYGFPSYTLLGSRVLRLPFIIDTSLGHEIAHCWWGNGVYVDGAGGNWSEGLTTYVADYLYKERESRQAAREYRRQVLRNYATLVTPANDFPISRFQSRFDPVTKVIGYDKCAMVFHMLRRHIGEEAFWGALRDIYQKYLFRPASWQQLRESFELSSGKNLTFFFRQWVDHSGAPLPALEDVAIAPAGSGWSVTGAVSQVASDFDFSVPIVLQTAAGAAVARRLDVGAGKTPFVLNAADHPVSLTVDPDYDLFRRLYPSEIPPSINTIKSAPSVVVITAADLAGDLTKAADTLLLSLGVENYRVVTEDRLDVSAVGESDLLLIGLPNRTDLLSAVDGKVTLTKGSFELEGVTYRDPTDVFFGVFERSGGTRRATALFFPLSSECAELVARKITHYGSYSYLAFNRGQNRAKGVWPTLASPLIHRWGPGETERPAGSRDDSPSALLAGENDSPKLHHPSHPVRVFD